MLKKMNIVRKFKSKINLNLNWLKFSRQDKTSAKYINSLTNIELKSIAIQNKLEQAVRKQLKKEFPNIEKTKSYELLVDAVMHNLRKHDLNE